ncbi:LptF/LptG family permease [Thermodesulfobium sp.]|jgi:lipopolysaccharide export system permease protein
MRILFNKLFWSYILNDFLPFFFFGLLAFSGLMLAGESMRTIKLVADNQGSFLTGVKLAACSVPYSIAFAFPMATLLGVLMAVSRISSNWELVALRSAGLSIFKFSLPFMVIGVIFSAVSFFTFEKLAYPLLNTSRYIIAGELKKELNTERQNVLFKLPPDNPKPKFIIFAKEYKPATMSLEGVYIQEFDNEFLKRTIYASNLEFSGNRWVASKGLSYEFSKDGIIVGRLDFEKLIVPLGVLPQAIKTLPAKKPRDMSFFELLSYLSNSKDIVDKSLYVDLYNKISLPFACFAFACIGVAFGIATDRKSSVLGFGIAITTVLVYYLIFSLLTTLGYMNYIPPFIASFGADILLTIFGIFMVVKWDT